MRFSVSHGKKAPLFGGAFSFSTIPQQAYLNFFLALKSVPLHTENQRVIPKAATENSELDMKDLALIGELPWNFEFKLF